MKFLTIAGQWAQIFSVNFRNNLGREIYYRQNFVAGFLLDMSWYGLELVFFKFLYSHTSSIAGWTQQQTQFLLGFFFIADGLFSFLFSRNFWNFVGLIHRGELDLYLLKPVNTIFLTLTRSLAISSLFSMVFGLLVLLRAAPEAGFSGSLLAWVQLLAWVAAATAVQFVFRFVMVVLVFWSERGWVWGRLYYSLYSLASKPDTMFPSIVRGVLLTILPFAWTAAMPTRALLGSLNALEWISLVGVLFGMSFLGRALWFRGLRRYQSASS